MREMKIVVMVPGGGEGMMTPFQALEGDHIVEVGRGQIEGKEEGEIIGMGGLGEGLRASHLIPIKVIMLLQIQGG